jgi:hypothetical protein
MASHTTAHYQIVVPDFASAPWHAILTTAIDKIDSVLYGIGVAAGAPLWANNKVYVLGNMVQDAVSGDMYMCLVGHTSAVSPAIFSAERVLHPTFWQVVVATT